MTERACLAANEGKMKMKIREGEREDLADDGGGSQRGELGQVASKSSFEGSGSCQGSTHDAVQSAVAARSCAMRGRVCLFLFFSLSLSLYLRRL
jgi:hypothetical protein